MFHSRSVVTMTNSSDLHLQDYGRQQYMTPQMKLVIRCCRFNFTFKYKKKMFAEVYTIRSHCHKFHCRKHILMLSYRPQPALLRYLPPQQPRSTYQPHSLSPSLTIPSVTPRLFILYISSFSNPPTSLIPNPQSCACLLPLPLNRVLPTPVHSICLSPPLR